MARARAVRAGVGAALPLRAQAPAKINLGLFVGPRRADGRHELVTVMQSITLADDVVVDWAGADRAGSMPCEPEGVAAPVAGAAGEPMVGDRGQVADEVVCPGVPGPPADNLAAVALARFRAATAWGVPPLRVTIDKRVPVAAGLGGGSGDAAAVLRLGARAAGLDPGEAMPLLLELAAAVGSDVPGQIRPGRWLASATGERLRELPAPQPGLGVLVVPVDDALSTAAVYDRADRLGALRSAGELRDVHSALGAGLREGAPLPSPALLVNDLETAARFLCPQLDDALEVARRADADVVMLSGSGPTALGLFAGPDGPERAHCAAGRLADRRPAVIAAAALGPSTPASSEPTAAGAPGPAPGTAPGPAAGVGCHNLGDR